MSEITPDKTFFGQLLKNKHSNSWRIDMSIGGAKLFTGIAANISQITSNNNITVRYLLLVVNFKKLNLSLETIVSWDSFLFHKHTSSPPFLVLHLIFSGEQYWICNMHTIISIYINTESLRRANVIVYSAQL